MKKIFTLLLLLSAFITNAQRTMFGGQNNYVVPSAPTYQGPAIVTSDLLLNLDADNPTSYPGNGNTWYDLSTNSNNGTIGSNTIANISSTPKKFTFNGTTSNVSFVSSKFNTPFTGKTVMVAAKMNASFGTNLYRLLFGNELNNGYSRNFNFYIRQNGSNYQLHFSTSDQWWLSDVVTLVTDQWYIFSFTQNSNTVVFYVNGDSVGTFTGPSAGAGIPSVVQYKSVTNEFLGGDGSWYGDINTALVYKRGLSNDEILQNYNALKSRFGL
jgi:hypothetical protein